MFSILPLKVCMWKDLSNENHTMDEKEEWNSELRVGKPQNKDEYSASRRMVVERKHFRINCLQWSQGQFFLPMITCDLNL